MAEMSPGWAGLPANEPGELKVVVDALRHMRNPPVIDDCTAADREKLTELLLDRSNDIDGIRLLYYLRHLQLAELVSFAQEAVKDSHLLVNPLDVADAVAVRVFTQLMMNKRVKPFGDWAKKLSEELVVRMASSQKHNWWPGGVESDFPPQVRNAMVRLFNLQDSRTRELLWLSWVEKLPVSELATRTGIPLERVEHLIESCLEQATREYRRAMGMDPYESDQRDPWDLPGSESEEGPNEF